MGLMWGDLPKLPFAKGEVHRSQQRSTLVGNKAETAFPLKKLFQKNKRAEILCFDAISPTANGKLATCPTFADLSLDRSLCETAYDLVLEE